MERIINSIRMAKFANKNISRWHKTGEQVSAIILCHILAVSVKNDTRCDPATRLLLEPRLYIYLHSSISTNEKSISQ